MGYIIDNTRFEVSLRRLIQLEQAEKDLKRARHCIKKLRLENSILKEEIFDLIDYGNQLLAMWAKIGVKTKSFVPPLWAWDFNIKRQI